MDTPFSTLIRTASHEQHTEAETSTFMSDLLGGQCEAGFGITDMYEDYMLDSPLHKYHPSFIATRAVKMK